MKTTALIIGAIALLITIGAPFLVFAGKLEDTAMKNALLGATILWVVAMVPFVRSGEE